MVRDLSERVSYAELVHHLFTSPSSVGKIPFFYQTLSLYLNAFEATLNWKFVQLTFLLLRIAFGFTSEGVVISLSVVADGSLHLASAVADEFGV